MSHISKKEDNKKSEDPLFDKSAFYYESAEEVLDNEGGYIPLEDREKSRVEHSHKSLLDKKK